MPGEQQTKGTALTEKERNNEEGGAKIEGKGEKCDCQKIKKDKTRKRERGNKIRGWGVRLRESHRKETILILNEFML